MTRKLRPPPKTIDGVRIRVYAVIDEDVDWTGDSGGPIVLVGGEFVGPVPRMAIGLNYDRKDYIALYCSKTWKSLAAVGSRSLEEALARAEQEYRGISSKWVSLG